MADELNLDELMELLGAPPAASTMPAAASDPDQPRERRPRGAQRARRLPASVSRLAAYLLFYAGSIAFVLGVLLWFAPVETLDILAHPGRMLDLASGLFETIWSLLTRAG